MLHYQLYSKYTKNHQMTWTCLKIIQTAGAKENGSKNIQKVPLWKDQSQNID